MKKKIIFITGAESSATRYIYKCFLTKTKDENIKNKIKNFDNYDQLSDVWKFLEKGNKIEAKKKLEKLSKKKLLISRRSIPYAQHDKVRASFLDFPKFEDFYEIINKKEYDIFFIITIRHPIGNIASAANNRASTQGDRNKVFFQYKFAYVKLLELIKNLDLNYFFLPIESIILDKDTAIDAIINVLGIDYDKKTKIPPVSLNINSKYFKKLK